jgi:hypothetical protein
VPTSGSKLLYNSGQQAALQLWAWACGMCIYIFISYIRMRGQVVVVVERILIFVVVKYGPNTQSFKQEYSSKKQTTIK